MLTQQYKLLDRLFDTATMKFSTTLTVLGSMAIGLQGVQAAAVPSILGSKSLVVELIVFTFLFFSVFESASILAVEKVIA